MRTFIVLISGLLGYASVAWALLPGSRVEKKCWEQCLSTDTANLTDAYDDIKDVNDQKDLNQILILTNFLTIS